MKRYARPACVGVMFGSLAQQLAWGFTTPFGVALFVASGLAITATFIPRRGTQ